VRSIAGQYGVSADVARRALGLLVQHGQVKAEARRHVVADPAAGAPTLQELAARLEALEHDVADLRTQLAAPSGSRRAAPDSD
jgi:DNA-binding GntR family transcriptional regulator